MGHHSHDITIEMLPISCLPLDYGCPFAMADDGRSSSSSLAQFSLFRFFRFFHSAVQPALPLPVFRLRMLAALQLS